MQNRHDKIGDDDDDDDGDSESFVTDSETTDNESNTEQVPTPPEVMHHIFEMAAMPFPCNDLILCCANLP